MTNTNNITEVKSKLLLPNSIPTPVDLAIKLREDLKTRASDAAMFLQQVHYWLTKEEGFLYTEEEEGQPPQTHRWIWNTYQQWREKQFPWWTDWDFRVITKKLRELDLIVFKQLKDCGRDRTGCYRLNYEHKWLKALIPHERWGEMRDWRGNNSSANSLELFHPPLSRHPRDHDDCTSDEAPTPSAVCAPDKTDTTPLKITSDTTTSVAEEKQKKTELPQAEKLKRLAVDIKDMALLKIVAQYPERITDAIAAWLAWAASMTNLSAPTRSLIKAIKESWKPEKPMIVNEINPPSPEIMQKLNELRCNGHIEAVLCQQWGDGVATVIVTSGALALPWWEYIKVIA